MTVISINLGIFENPIRENGIDFNSGTVGVNMRPMSRCV